jgi:hypothetical protein
MYVDFVEQRATIHAYVSFGLLGWGIDLPYLLLRGTYDKIIFNNSQQYKWDTKPCYYLLPMIIIFLFWCLFRS